MKKILVVSLVALLFSVSAFAGAVKVSVDGMVCAFCAQGIKKKFSENPAVEKCEVDLEKKTVDVTFKKDKSMTDAEIMNTIKGAGYAVHKLERIQ